MKYLAYLCHASGMSRLASRREGFVPYLQSLFYFKPYVSLLH